MTKLILISGYAEHGKSLTAKLLKEKIEQMGKTCTILPFAAYLKFICKEHFGWDGQKTNVGRKLLQEIGTDIIRKRNPDFWVEEVGRFIDVFSQEFDFIISDDVRFPNEIKYFRNKSINFLTIWVTRLDYENSLTPEQRKHPSETSLNYYPFDIYLLSKTGKDKLEKVVDTQIFNNPVISSWMNL